MKFGQSGFISFGVMTLIVGGLALAGLLAYGWTTGQELPVGPAIVVVLVNIIAAVKLALDSRKGRPGSRDTGAAAGLPEQGTGRK